jgi:hypothetical protein
VALTTEARREQVTAPGVEGRYNANQFGRSDMTKHVRVENADTSDYKVVVEVWDKGYPAGEPDKLAFTENLDFPTAMTSGSVYLTSTRYLVVKEKPVSQDQQRS